MFARVRPVALCVLLLAARVPLAAQEATEAPARQASASVAAEDLSPRPRLLDASREIEAIEIDGVIEEAEWQDAQVFTGFIQRQPVEGAPVEFDTQVRVLFGDGAIWVAARMWDPTPQSIATRLTRRDAFGGPFDAFGIQFDPNSDHLTGYNFGISAAGVQSDQYIFNDDQRDNAWDAVWESATRIDEQGWTAEMRIPLAQIRYEASESPQTWGVSFSRFRLANNERSGLPLISQLRRGAVSQMMRLENVLVTSSARRLEVLPYVVSSLHRGPAEDGDPFFDGSAAAGRVGVDLSYGLGAAFTLDAAINPDFGQVEADPAVINLSAFETFFREQRPFFVEDARVFDFTLSGGQNQLFYSRRVGRSPHGSAPSSAVFSEVPENATILGAAKLAGRTTSGLSVGALMAVTGNEHGQALYGDASRGDFLVEPRSEYGTVSVAKDLRGGASQIGVLGTAMRRELPGDGSFDWLPSSAFSGGVRFNHQWNDRDWAVYGYVAGSYLQGSESAITRIQRSSIHYWQRPDATRFRLDPNATSMSGRDWRLTLEKQNGEHWTGSVWAAEVSNGFEVNDVGYSTRTEVLDGGAAVNYREIRPGEILRSYDFGLRMFHNWSHEALDDAFSIGSWNDARTGGGYNASANVQFMNYSNARVQFGYNPQRMDRRQTRGGPMMQLPANFQINGNYNTDRRARFSFGFGGGFGWDQAGLGGGGGGSVNLNFQPSDRLSFSVSPSYNRQRTGTQYVTATSTLSYGPTYGVRYLFADLRQNQFSMDTRLDWTFSPTLTLQLYAQPLIASGDYLEYKQLAAPGTYEFLDLAYTNVGGTNQIDFDNDGTPDYALVDRDFNLRSLIGNAVLRWEYRPGSTLFIVWQRVQSGYAQVGDLDLGRDVNALFAAPADNRFILKLNYWLGL